jgi:1,4-alpha-glucan branching enzyme
MRRIRITNQERNKTMKKNETSQTGRHSQADSHVHKVALSCHAPEAKAVFVAGTFNDWKPDATPLHNHLPHAKWTVTLPLAAGHHEYKFVVDGQWCCEPGTADEFRDDPKCCVNSFGTMNRVLEVR